VGHRRGGLFPVDLLPAPDDHFMSSARPRLSIRSFAHLEREGRVQRVAGGGQDSLGGAAWGHSAREPARMRPSRRRPTRTAFLTQLTCPCTARPRPSGRCWMSIARSNLRAEICGTSLDQGSARQPLPDCRRQSVKYRHPSYT
jgi:hypothetical protein